MVSNADAVQTARHAALQLTRPPDAAVPRSPKHAAVSTVNDKAAATATGASPGSKFQFRPDIDGLRAYALIYILIFHGYHLPLGGYVSVDVFFVISGFLITGLLINEEARKGRVSIARFYARRARRILPASAVVIITTVFVSYRLLGFIAGNAAAVDGKWTAIFAANIDFGISGTDYLGSQLPPSPLQNMWSLGVEEQFYVVWPTLFLLVTIAIGLLRRKLRTGLTVILIAIIAVSFAWSVLQTQTNATWAYFSPFTRAWELAIGALVAVWAPELSRLIRPWLAQVLAAVGVLGILVCALIYTIDTPYPGSAVAIPILCGACIIAAGCHNPNTFFGRFLSLRPMQWMGARSYSIYLWHWPFLIIPVEYAGHELNPWQTLALIFAAIAAGAITYPLVENPIRNSKFLKDRTGLSLAMGLGLVVLTITFAQWQIATHYGSWNPFAAVGFQ